MTDALCQPRWLCYARAHQMTPEAIKARDTTHTRSGAHFSGLAYVGWLSGQRREFQKERPECFDRAGELLHVFEPDFGSWLEARWP